MIGGASSGPHWCTWVRPMLVVISSDFRSLGQAPIAESYASRNRFFSRDRRISITSAISSVSKGTA
jgi:hypothetical protein